jgi:ADP-heptose:LPS heptosyltransferase
MPLPSFAALLSRSRVYVGNDSGPTHLAAAVGTRVVAVFGPTDPRIWAPRGSSVRIVAAGSGLPPAQRLGAVSAGRVLDAVEALTSGSVP